MNREEAAKLLSLIKLSYPQSYRDIGRQMAEATVNMWAMTFGSVPYPVMERAFNSYRMVSKYPPTVAEMAQQLKKLYYDAEDAAFVHLSMGNMQKANQLRQIMDCTRGFAREHAPALAQGRRENFGQVGSAGASGNYVGITDGLPQLDAGKGQAIDGY